MPAQRAYSTKKSSCKIVCYEWHYQYKKPEGIHSDGPVHLHYEMNKQDEDHKQEMGKVTEAINNKDMLFGPFQYKNKSKEQYSNADVGNKPMFVSGKNRRDWRNNAVYDKTCEQDNGSPCFLVADNRVKFKFN